MRPPFTSGPASITLVRHAHSLGNEADSAAREAGAEELDLDHRDADVQLSPTGCGQAESLGRWMASQDTDAHPDLVVTSPYRRALETARLATDVVDVELLHDERLRERDLGVLDGLTGLGIRTRHPDEAERRKKLGKFYYQPPSGESWCA